MTTTIEKADISMINKLNEKYKEESGNHNSLKSFANLYVYFILKKHSNEYNKYTVKKVGEELQREYGIEMERKALGRIVNGLSQIGVGICYDSKVGAWFDKDKATII